MAASNRYDVLGTRVTYDIEYNGCDPLFQGSMVCRLESTKRQAMLIPIQACKGLPFGPKIVDDVKSNELS